MTPQLKRHYVWMLSPALAGFVIALPIRHLYPAGMAPEPMVAVLAPLLLASAAAFGVAGPIFYRSVFAYRQKGLMTVSADALYKFERHLIGIALVAPYLALIAYVLNLPRFHFAGSVLAALYAVYYTYPSDKRIRFDKRIFRVVQK